MWGAGASHSTDGRFIGSLPGPTFTSTNDGCGPVWGSSHTLTTRGKSLERVTAIGAVFFRARDPEALRSWYADNLGFTDGGPDIPAWQPGLGQTVCPFPEDTDYFGRREQTWMLNFKVRDLDAMLDQLRAAGAGVDDRVEDYDYGRFGWATDPEGNRFELWQPIPGAPAEQVPET